MYAIALYIRGSKAKDLFQSLILNTALNISHVRFTLSRDLVQLRHLSQLSLLTYNDCFFFTNTIGTGKYYYGARIVTGRCEGAGTKDTDVYITLIGSKASSGKITVGGWLKALKGSCSRHTFDDLIIESDGDLGQVLVVGVGNEKDLLTILGAPWFVDFVMVHDFQSNLNEEFPVYHWIGDGDYVTCTAHTSECKQLFMCSRIQALLIGLRLTWWDLSLYIYYTVLKTVAVAACSFSTVAVLLQPPCLFHHLPKQLYIHICL